MCARRTEEEAFKWPGFFLVLLVFVYSHVEIVASSPNQIITNREKEEIAEPCHNCCHHHCTSTRGVLEKNKNIIIVVHASVSLA